MGNNWDELVSKPDKTDNELVLVVAIMQLSVQPAFSRFTMSEIYDQLLKIGLETFEVKHAG